MVKSIQRRKTQRPRVSFKPLKTRADVEQAIRTIDEAKAKEDRQRISDLRGDWREKVKERRQKEQDFEQQRIEAKKYLRSDLYDLSNPRIMEELRNIIETHPEQYIELSKNKIIENLAKNIELERQKDLERIRLQQAQQAVAPRVFPPLAPFPPLPPAQLVASVADWNNYNRSHPQQSVATRIAFNRSIAEVFHSVGADTDQLIRAHAKALKRNYGMEIPKLNDTAVLTLIGKIRQLRAGNWQGGKIRKTTKTTKDINMSQFPKEVMMRLKILIGEIRSGNNNPQIKNEAYNILDFLLKHKIIAKNQHAQMVKDIGLIH